ncbi:hypothetical protein IX317_000622 [Fusobacterium sp. DD29]|uniref:virulence-associated E family protein n=1 Tax=unclassified Fusobacterium TaxID=2648384 RepID=UPI001B8D0244|nr:MULTISPECIES: virulence-associated E family protein [unclassified Fusobacterium]MBR8700256.1 hypothetical protein [Fusobacterium sp. DD45]MBR8710489.1 hypothetical protein [Fusobacterium sp. DD28]MBR8748961.1 hypothetical protein [Fusobacterium sp. DD29]MBR8751061.1 hypothetical protein [Fusobacterium sp. DD26]MBR8761267.1 hypothetical protein [Fusobacterium sp. DD25]
MVNNRLLKLALATNRFSKSWKTIEMSWASFVDRISKPIVTEETITTYMRLSKKDQDNLKDVGGFVGGNLSGPNRIKEAVHSRSLITLDMDNMCLGDDTAVLKTLNALGCGYAVYSTRKHSKIKPRLRVILPLAYDVTPDEYEPIARKIAEIIGIKYCDPTTFQADRLMYWPSHSKDSDYVFTYEDKPMVDGKGILKMYADWKDITSWSVIPGCEKLYENMLKKQENPTEKSGLIGAFCRRYDIRETIAEFLPDAYTETDIPDRLTYSGGSTSAGAVIYGDGLFLYSHHATDPCSQKLVNSFDLLRLHKFGHLDEEADPNTPVNRLPSWKATMDFIRKNTNVADDLLVENIKTAQEEFAESMEFINGGIDTAEVVQEGEVVHDTEWMKQLDAGADGTVAPTLPNLLIILANSPELKGKIFTDTFSNRMMVEGALPWDNNTEERLWTDTDDAGIRWYLEKIFDITGKSKIEDAVNLTAKNNARNSVEEYLKSLAWDGVERLPTMFVDYLGCADNAYTREVAEKTMIAAVKRAVSNKSIKWDTMPVVIGPQGKGKSTFLRKLGGNWYNDSLVTFEGKEACEIIQGSWIVEVGELTGLRKSEKNAAKQFLSRQEDIFREAYGRRTNIYPRRCVFIGTSNDAEFLNDESGGRRFWPIDAFTGKTKKSIFDDLDDEVEQLWAEAYNKALDNDISLLLGEEASELARIEQEEHKEGNMKKGLILDYLDKKLPENWYKLDLYTRRLILDEYDERVQDTWVERDRVCVAEIWEEALKNDKRFIKPMDSREITAIMSNLKDWERIKSTARFGSYGIQKGFKKCKPDV